MGNRENRKLAEVQEQHQRGPEIRRRAVAFVAERPGTTAKAVGARPGFPEVGSGANAGELRTRPEHSESKLSGTVQESRDRDFGNALNGKRVGRTKPRIPL